jgi:hypothetical protein
MLKQLGTQVSRNLRKYSSIADKTYSDRVKISKEGDQIIVEIPYWQSEATNSGPSEELRTGNLIKILDGYFNKGGQHLNINAVSKETLIDAMEHPELYPNLSIRVSGYSVKWTKLTKEQQLEVLNRTYHDKM